MHEPIDWQRILFADQPPIFLFEVLFRTVIMFTVVLLALKLTGKRGVRQLSIFETVIIIVFGSAAGDPMFYDDVAMVPALFVFIIIICLYRLVTWLTGVSKKFEKAIEGKAVCLIVEGKFAHEEFKKEVLAQDEFFTELRVKSIEHLGQVRYAYLEPSGEVSVFYYPDDDVRYGLPIRPEIYAQNSNKISGEGLYACAFCGNVEELSAGNSRCARCGHDHWLQAINDKRVS
jgi:uncharacterized membrane protein YcaP (DUF421 family)